MKKNQILIGLVLLVLCGCSNSFQYDVYVKNSTGSEITIDFKSINDKQGVIENSLVLKDGEYKRIISTNNITWDEERVMATPKQCDQVAEYVTAKMGGVESNLKWCDENIQFSHEDIGQGSFTIEYSKSNFES